MSNSSKKFSHNPNSRYHFKVVLCSNIPDPNAITISKKLLCFTVCLFSMNSSQTQILISGKSLHVSSKSNTYQVSWATKGHYDTWYWYKYWCYSSMNASWELSKSEKQKVEIMSLSSLERSILSSQTELPPGS